VPADGNCTETKAHLDPFGRGEDTPCDSSQPATCQVGDNSGKYGKITSDPYFATYHDLYTSLQESIPGSFFGDRSFVLHFANKTRITCANFTPLNSTGVYPTGGGYPTGTAYPTGTGSVFPTGTPSATHTPENPGSPTGAPAPSATAPISAANSLASATSLVVAPVMALLLLLW
jgi:PAB1-binding protein PBP1